MLGNLALRLVAAIFFVSGAAGLVYEVLWTRQLSLIFGVTTYAVATVLSAFMAGLALGSYVIGRWIDRRQNALAAYAVLEAAIGIYALLVPVLFVALQPAYVFLRQLDLSYPVLAFARAVLAALVLLPPTTLMGGTFPILVRYWVRARDEVGRGAGLLYFINTAGAMAGCVFAGFYLIEHFGLTGSTRLAAGTNLAVAAVAGVLARGAAARGAAAPSAPSAGEETDTPAPILRLALFAVGLSGFTSLGYQVLWTRALLRYLYNSTYAFTTMLATFLLGIALGSALYAVGLRRLRRPVLVFAALQAFVGLGFVASSLVFPVLPDVLSALLGTDPLGSFAQSMRRMFVGSSLIILPPAVLLGAMLPLAMAVCVGDLAKLGYTVGRVYAINTLGAIFGSLVAGFVLIPTIGMQGTLTLLVSTNLALAAILAMAELSSARTRLLAGAMVAVVGIAAVSVTPSDFFIRTLPRHKIGHLLYYHEGATDTVAVTETWGQRVILYGDRRGTAGTTSYPFDFLTGHLPMLLHPGEPRRALHICFGVGNSLSALTAHEELERVDSVELSPHVIDAAQYFWTNNDVISNPKVRMIIDDGRNFLLATREVYDVITLAPPETFTAGVINLYTRDFYRDAAEHLAPDGIMLQWVPPGKAPLEEERMLFRAFYDVFPHSTAWSQLGTGVLLVGSQRPLRIDYQRLRQKMQRERVREDLELMKIRDVDHLLSLLLLDEEGFAEFVAGVEPTTDDRTVLDFSMPRYAGAGFGFSMWSVEAGKKPWAVAAERRRYYLENRRSIVPYLRNLGGESRRAIARRIAARTTDSPHKVTVFPEHKWQRW